MDDSSVAGGAFNLTREINPGHRPGGWAGGLCLIRSISLEPRAKLFAPRSDLVLKRRFSHLGATSTTPQGDHVIPRPPHASAAELEPSHLPYRFILSNALGCHTRWFEWAATGLWRKPHSSCHRLYHARTMICGLDQEQPECHGLLLLPCPGVTRSAVCARRALPGITASVPGAAPRPPARMDVDPKVVRRALKAEFIRGAQRAAPRWTTRPGQWRDPKVELPRVRGHHSAWASLTAFTRASAYLFGYLRTLRAALPPWRAAGYKPATPSGNSGRSSRHIAGSRPRYWFAAGTNTDGRTDSSRPRRLHWTPVPRHRSPTWAHPPIAPGSYSTDPRPIVHCRCADGYRRDLPTSDGCLHHVRQFHGSIYRPGSVRSSALPSVPPTNLAGQTGQALLAVRISSLVKPVALLGRELSEGF